MTDENGHYGSSYVLFVWSPGGWTLQQREASRLRSARRSRTARRSFGSARSARRRCRATGADAPSPNSPRAQFSAFGGGFAPGGRRSRLLLLLPEESLQRLLDPFEEEAPHQQHSCLAKAPAERPSRKAPKSFLSLGLATSTETSSSSGSSVTSCCSRPAASGADSLGGVVSSTACFGPLTSTEPPSRTNGLARLSSGGMASATVVRGDQKPNSTVTGRPGRSSRSVPARSWGFPSRYARAPRRAHPPLAWARSVSPLRTRQSLFRRSEPARLERRTPSRRCLARRQARPGRHR